jgi:putative hydrolase of the HAD superfamily
VYRACELTGRLSRGDHLTAITTIFWDVGGVLLTNAWDRTERQQALDKFGLDAAAFQQRHEPLVAAFERGEITLEQYLDETVFYEPRTFSKQDFQQNMFSLSRANAEALTIARQLRDTRKYLMGTINNESRELNLYRIQQFQLQEIFTVFVSSCFVRLRKPHKEIYQLSLEITQRAASECCFIDDREQNLEAPAGLGMHTIQMKGAPQLREALSKLGVNPG